jgi:hypothetical protein
MDRYLPGILLPDAIREYNWNCIYDLLTLNMGYKDPPFPYLEKPNEEESKMAML